MKKYRSLAEMTQQEVADELKIGVQRYKHYEAGRRAMGIEMAVKIADVFKISLDDLVGR